MCWQDHSASSSLSLKDVPRLSSRLRIHSRRRLVQNYELITQTTIAESILLHAGYPSYCPTNSVKALKEQRPLSLWKSATVDARRGEGSGERLIMGSGITPKNIWKYRCKLVQFGAFFGDQRNRKCTTQCLVKILEDQSDDVRSSNVAQKIDTFLCNF